MHSARCPALLALRPGDRSLRTPVPSSPSYYREPHVWPDQTPSWTEILPWTLTIGAAAVASTVSRLLHGSLRIDEIVVESTSALDRAIHFLFSLADDNVASTSLLSLRQLIMSPGFDDTGAAIGGIHVASGGPFVLRPNKIIYRGTSRVIAMVNNTTGVGINVSGSFTITHLTQHRDPHPA